jgi:hypothetical protein
MLLGPYRAEPPRERAVGSWRERGIVVDKPNIKSLNSKEAFLQIFSGQPVDIA